MTNRVSGSINPIDELAEHIKRITQRLDSLERASTSGSGGGGGTGVDEVWIGATAPADPLLELWYDTDAANPMHGFRLAGASAIFTNATITAVGWVSESYDPDSLHSGSNTHIQIGANLAGLWQFGFSLDFQANAAGGRHAWMRKSGVTAVDNYYGYQSSYSVGGAVATIVGGVSQIRLAAGDYVEVLGYQDSGVTLNAAASGAGEFWGHYLGAM